MKCSKCNGCNQGRDCQHKDESLALVLTVIGFIGLGLLIAAGV